MKKLFLIMSFLIVMLVLAGCAGDGGQTGGTSAVPQPPIELPPEPEPVVEEPQVPQGGTIILATTTSTYDSRLLDFLLPNFTEETGWTVHVVSVGTGAALQIGRDGEADVVLVHARALEDQFVEDGYAERRYDIMYNDFIMLGPADGPVTHNNDIEATFAYILENNLTFVSRGDNSGTHVRELDIWENLGLIPEDNENYKSVGEGMGVTLTLAIELDAYVLSDRATWLNRADHGNLVVVCEGSPDLLNPYGIMIVSQAREPEGARIFVDWMIGERGQYLIGSFGVEEFGSRLFFPEAE